MDNLVRKYQLTNDSKILEKIINQLEDVINYFLKNNKLNLPDDELYDYIVEGIIMASKSYMFYGVSFKSYVNLWIGRIFLRLNSKLLNENKLFENFLEVLSMMEKKHKKVLNTNLELLDITLEEMDSLGLLYPYSYDDAKKIISQMLKTIAISNNTKTLNDDIRSKENEIDSKSLISLIKSLLTKQEYDYIVSYYGLSDRDTETLEEIGKRYNITGESVRQTKENALKKIGYILNTYTEREKKFFNIDKIIEFLEDFLSYQEIDYLCHTFSIFNYSKKNYQELTELYHESANTIEIKVGMIIEKITFLINHLNLFNISEINNLYHLLEAKLTKEEFNIFKDYYGLFNTSKKTIQEISELYSVDTICITKLLTIINSKLKDLENNSNLNKFLSNILTTFEYEVLSNINNISLNKDIQTILNMIITKINLLYKYQNLNIDKESLKDFLQTILSNNEYRNISLRYGLFNSPRTKLPINTLYRLSINDKKILHKIAIFLNIENTKNKSI